MTEPSADQWRTAALLKDRTRRAIRERVRAGESPESIAADYDIPPAFVEMLIHTQLFEGEASSADGKGGEAIGSGNQRTTDSTPAQVEGGVAHPPDNASEIQTEACERCGAMCPAGWCGQCHAPTKALSESFQAYTKRLIEGLQAELQQRADVIARIVQLAATCREKRRQALMAGQDRDTYTGVLEWFAKELDALASSGAPPQKWAHADPKLALDCMRNMGIDTQCGACMEVAFTGVTTNEHTCASGAPQRTAEAKNK